MLNENKTMCESFNSNLFLYMNNELPIEQKELYRGHLKYCSDCRKLLKETEELLALSSTAIEEDIEDARFEFMINKAVTKKQNGFIKRFFVYEENKKGNPFLLGKIAFSSAFAIIAVVVTLLIEKPYTVPANIVNQEIVDWEGDGFNSAISELRAKLYDDEWNEGEAELLLIDERINQLLKID